MAKVLITAKVVGGTAQSLTAETVSEVKQQLGVSNYQASINGEPAEDTDILSEGDYLTFAPAVKGAAPHHN